MLKKNQTTKTNLKENKYGKKCFFFKNSVPCWPSLHIKINFKNTKKVMK